jgi:hypothetical protein
MIVFVDFEASSLSKLSFPIEVAWVFPDGRHRSCLIRPPSDWTDWSDDAERIHGISKDMLQSEGLPVDVVANTMLRELQGHDLYASAPSWDGKWLSVLLRAAGLPRHALRLKRSDEVFMETARLEMGKTASEHAISTLVNSVIEATTDAISPAHRALPDARLELDRWNMVRRAAAGKRS